MVHPSPDPRENQRQGQTRTALTCAIGTAGTVVQEECEEGDHLEDNQALPTCHQCKVAGPHQKGVDVCNLMSRRRDFKAVFGVAQTSEPTRSQCCQLVMRRSQHVGGRAGETSTIFNTRWQAWPLE